SLSLNGEMHEEGYVALLQLEHVKSLFIHDSHDVFKFLACYRPEEHPTQSAGNAERSQHVQCRCAFPAMSTLTISRVDLRDKRAVADLTSSLRIRLLHGKGIKRLNIRWCYAEKPRLEKIKLLVGELVYIRPSTGETDDDGSDEDDSEEEEEEEEEEDDEEEEEEADEEKKGEDEEAEKESRYRIPFPPLSL
ncbi:hypothetical protein H0H87_001658, partial [Tephrocybe sp. NHM501043]